MTKAAPATRWFPGAVAAPPPAAAASRFPGRDERVRIADRLRMTTAGPSRPVSAISRVLDRDRRPDGTHQPYAAHGMAAARRAGPKIGKPASDPVLRATIQGGPDARRSAIGTLVERDTRSVVLLNLPDGPVDNSAVAGVAVDNPT
jgi:hypothetical protein